MPRNPRQVELGDFQTPDALALAVCRRLAADGAAPASILEPTCGDGAFLAAAFAVFPDARLVGVEIDPARAATARRRAPQAEIHVGDAFVHDWEGTLSALPSPVWVLGNPPWVTNAAVGALGGTNRPARRNTQGLSGLEALTGASNFDVSEWILRRLHAATGAGDRLAMFVKTSVARRMLALPDLRPLGLWRIDAQRHFDASVDAGLFAFERGEPRTCPAYADLEAIEPDGAWGVRDGQTTSDVDAYDAAREALKGALPQLSWRSGVKHDCARVLELRGGHNGLGERVDVEPEVLYPLLKSTDLHRGRAPSRAVLLPQTRLGEAPERLATAAPRAWAYLQRHGARLDGRRSRIYRDRPRFAVFGVGEYSFSDWKVAISGLHTPPRFRVVGPHEGRPVLFDDTCYCAPMPDETEARRVAAVLGSAPAQRLLAALLFEGAKRPVTKRVLQAL